MPFAVITTRSDGTEFAIVFDLSVISIFFKRFPPFSRSITNAAEPTFGFTPPLKPAPKTATHLSTLLIRIRIILGVDHASPNFE